MRRTRRATPEVKSYVMQGTECATSALYKWAAEMTRLGHAVSIELVDRGGVFEGVVVVDHTGCRDMPIPAECWAEMSIPRAIDDEDTQPISVIGGMGEC